METNLKVILIKVKLKIWENIFFVMEILYKVNLIKIKLQKWNYNLLIMIYMKDKCKMAVFQVRVNIQKTME